MFDEDRYEAALQSKFPVGARVRYNCVGAKTVVVLSRSGNVLYTTGGPLHVSKAVVV